MSTPHPSFIGLKPRELEQFNLGRLIDALARRDESALTLPRQVSSIIEGATGRAPSTINSLFLPADLLLQRDLTAGGGGTSGGYLTASSPVTFGQAVFGQSLLGVLPMRPLSLDGAGGGTVAVPTSATTTWMGTEASTAADANMVFASRALTAKTIAITTGLSRHMNLSSPAALPAVQQWLGEKLGAEASRALINGSGISGEPTGLLQLSGTTSTSGTSLAWTGIRDLIAASEGYGTSGLMFVAGVTTAKILRAREKATGSGMVFADGRIDGIPVVVSRACPDDALVLAPWPMVTFAQWGQLELTVTPMADATSFKQGRIAVRLMWTVDFVPDHPALVGKATSIT